MARAISNKAVRPQKRKAPKRGEQDPEADGLVRSRPAAKSPVPWDEVISHGAVSAP